MTGTSERITNKAMEGWWVYPDCETRVYDGSTRVLVDVACGGTTSRTLAQAEAAACLIAAAPDLLAALQEAVNVYGKPGGPWNVPSDPGGWITRARAAIARAGV